MITCRGSCCVVMMGSGEFNKSSISKMSRAERPPSGDAHRSARHFDDGGTLASIGWPPGRPHNPPSCHHARWWRVSIGRRAHVLGDLDLRRGRWPIRPLSRARPLRRWQRPQGLVERLCRIRVPRRRAREPPSLPMRHHGGTVRPLLVLGILGSAVFGPRRCRRVTPAGAATTRPLGRC